MSGRLAHLCTALCVILLVAAGHAARAQNGSPGYDVISRGAGGLELRFHNMPLREVHADDSQNALAVDFQSQIDGAAFDRLPGDFPDWIALAYADFDTGVIRATRPVTFLTRQEPDGFSLRIMPRDATLGRDPATLRGPADSAPVRAQTAPAPTAPVQIVQAQVAQAHVATAQAASAPGRGGDYGAMRNYAALELSLRRSDDVWDKVETRSTTTGDSDASLGSEFHAYHNGDRVIASQMHMRIGIGGGLSLIGSVYDTDATANQVRATNGSFAANTSDNLLTGAGGVAFDIGDNTAFTLEALEGNDITGARVTGYSGDPEKYWLMNLAWHDSDRDTPEAILSRGLKDQAVVSAGLHLGYGFWASFGGRFTNYGVHGNASIAKTAGWDGNIRWNADLDGLFAGLAYDGHGEYLLDNGSLVGAPPTPYIPLGIRNMETHAFTGSLSSLIWGDTLWLDLYGGYIHDRYASAGAIYGGSVRFQPAPGVSLALGARHSIVSWMQGEIGPETSAGLTFTLGFDNPAMSDYF